ncbi:MAG: hypothetical protein Q9187_002539 [Circinaria calcarea]
MNGDTIVVKTRDDGHRAKRIKREKIPARSSTTPSGLSTSQDPSNGVGHKQTIPNPGSLGDKTEALTSTVGTDIEALAVQAAQAAIADSISPENTNSMTSTTSSSRNQSQRPTNSLERCISDPMYADVDLSHVPSDPCGLRMWVAQQISHFQDVDLDASRENMDVRGGRLSSQSSRSRSSTIDDDTGSGIIRGDGKSYGGSFAQTMTSNEMSKRRGMHASNKGTTAKISLEDLILFTDKTPNQRGRVNKLAEGTLAPHNSAGKHVSTQTEIIKQRTKREIRQRTLASRAGRIPSFVLKSDIASSLFPSQDTEMNQGVHRIGSLLLNTLLSTSSDNSLGSNTAMANALRAALESKTLDYDSLVEALTIIASHPEIKQGINRLLSVSDDHNDLELVSGTENENQSEQAANAPTLQVPLTSQQSNEIIRVLNAASALFNDMANTKEYVTPYGDPPPKSGNANEYGKHRSNGNAIPSNLQEAPSERVLDPSQIDALLALANGGSLTEDDDDKTIADPDEINGQHSDEEGKSRTDMDVAATFQRIVNELAERNSGQSGNDRRGVPLSKPRADSYGSQTVRDKAATLLSLFSQAGVSINTIIPAAQSHATSQLYAHLSSRARSSTPSGGINPAHASAYGNTAQMNQRMLLKPGFLGQPQYMQNQPLQTLTPTSKGNIKGAPPRFKDAEEQEKIKKYGFPPLPGSRFGAKKQ